MARTLLDLAGVLAPGSLERAVERSLASRRFDLGAVQAVLAGNRRRPGAATLATLVSAMHDEPALTRSAREGLMRDLCDAHGVPRPAVNAIVDGREVDFHWAAERLIVETDGHEDHGTRAAFERDRARDAFLMTRGYRVARFTHRQVARRPAHVGATLRALLSPGAGR